MTKPRLTAVGLTCGIGSMLVGARNAGFQVTGNVEWRRYYGLKDKQGRNTFEQNFPGAFIKQKAEQLTDGEARSITGCTLALSHGECGCFSQMQGCNNFRDPETRKAVATNPGDLPLLVELISKFRPRFFAADNLPKSFLAFPMERYAEALPDYDLFPELVSNYHYGNIQKSRKRMFMIGALRDEGWAFVPGEHQHSTTLADVLDGLPVEPVAGEIPNHDPHDEESECGRGLHMDYPWHRPTWGDMRRWFEQVEEGESFRYYSPHAADGETKVKPGWYKQRWNGHCAVLDGGSGHMHPLRNLPFTIRERARIQGFPDDFIFYGTRLNDKGAWVHERNIDMVKQTGKAMPVQFCQYVAEQVRAHVEGGPFSTTGDRLIKPNPHVDEAKRWFCHDRGYSDQDRACDSCWLRDRCDLRSRVTTVELTVPTATTPRPTKEKTTMPAVKKRPSEPVAPRPAKSLRRSRPVVEVQTVETKVVEFRDKSRGPEIRVMPVNVFEGDIPADYHCRCRFCVNTIGELRPEDGSYYSRLERRGYYENSIESGEGGHVAKTPLHIARWAVQQYSELTDWVLDPTAGAGTTIVEALVQGRNAAGMELQFDEILSANVKRHAVGGRRAVIGFGDARNVADFLRGLKRTFPLIVNNPPYSGDEHWTTFKVSDGKREKGQWSETLDNYDKSLPNLAFLKEGDEYWRTMSEIYSGCVRFLRPGGRFVVGVKDQMRQKRSDQLHERFAELLESIGLEHEGTAFLKHYPSTLHLNTYGKRYGIQPPLYQSIVVFRKPG